MIDYPDCAISVQLIPTSLQQTESAELDRITQVLETLSKGVMDQGIGNVSFSLAERHAETYRYYAENKTQALYLFNVLIFGSSEGVTNIANRFYGQLSTGNDLSANLKMIDVDQTEVSKDSNFYPLPWAANEILLNKNRNLAIWNSGQFSNALYRLPYIISSDEAAELFHLPIGSDRVSAGLNVNESGKGQHTYP